MGPKYLGPLSHSQTLRQLDAASIFLHPAFYEPCGLSVLEAARCRCCLVLSDIPSLRELWEGAAIFGGSAACSNRQQKPNRISRDIYAPSA